MRAIAVAAVVALALVVPGGAVNPNPYRLASFDPGWAGVGNRMTTPPCHPTVFDFGYKATQNAGGEPGEIGGTLARSTGTLASYGTPVSEATYNSPLSASGKMRVLNKTGGGAQFGWYNSTESTEWRTSNALVLRVSGDSLGWNIYPETGSTNYLAVGGGTLPSGGVRLAYGTSYGWSMSYNPATFTVSVTVTGGAGPWSTSYVVPVQMREDGATFDRFGILSQQVEHASSINIFLDDVTVNGITYSFDTDPGWQGVNNNLSITDCVVHNREDYGASATSHASGHADEVGGTLWRSPKSYWADTTANTLDQDDTLYAEGVVRLMQATSDTDVFLGWFNDGATWTTGPPPAITYDAMYASIGGPSRVGFRVTPTLRSSTGLFVKEQFNTPTQYALPLLNARGSSRRFTICYQPNGNGTATISTSLDADPDHGIPAATAQIQVSAATRSSGLRVNRFGLFTGNTGGHSVGLWVDDLRYTIEPGDEC